jgi:hypothetical protein
MEIVHPIVLQYIAFVSCIRFLLPGYVSMASLVDPTLMLDRSSRCTSTRSSTQRMSLRKATPVLLAYQYPQDRVSHQPLYKYYKAYPLS